MLEKRCFWGGQSRKSLRKKLRRQDPGNNVMDVKASQEYCGLTCECCKQIKEDGDEENPSVSLAQVFLQRNGCRRVHVTRE